MSARLDFVPEWKLGGIQGDSEVCMLNVAKNDYDKVSLVRVKGAGGLSFCYEWGEIRPDWESEHLTYLSLYDVVM